MKLSSVLSAALLGARASLAVQTVQAVGGKFFRSDGTQFFIKGVAYQLTDQDPLVDTAQCGRDAALMSSLGANAIRVYHVNATADHSGCMQVFDDAGIYTLIDLDTFSTYILAEEPYWTNTQHDAYAAVLDAFARYNNTLAFFVGNEIIAKADQSQVAPYIKASARDMKAHRDAKGHRQIPIGYSAADIAELRPMLQDYLTCGGNTSDTIDFFSLNSYEWCDPSTYETSGYAVLEEQAKNFPVPVFFSETGCNVGPFRTFDDQAAIFGSNMVNDWSGSIIYEWIQETNHYGLVSYGASAPDSAGDTNVIAGFARSGTPTPVLPDFNNLKAQWATISPSGVMLAKYNASAVSTRDCPSSTSGGWLLQGNVALPTVGQKVAGSYASSPSATPRPTTSSTVGAATNGTGTSTSTSTSTSSGSAASASSTNNPAPANREMAGMSAGLVGVMLLFTVWF